MKLFLKKTIVIHLNNLDTQINFFTKKQLLKNE
jgi:hypothetical protein